MTDGHDLERRVAAFYAAEAPLRAPDRVLLDALATIDTTRQRRELALVPWRFHTMNNYARLAMAAVAVLAVGALGLTFLRPGETPSVGGTNPSPTPIPSLTMPPSPTTSPSELPSPPPLSGTFTSPVHGLTISYPADWTEAPATDPDSTAEPGFRTPASDFLHDPVLRDHLFIVLGSEALDGRTGEEWAAAVFSNPADECDAEREPATVDGAPGLVCDTRALTWVRDRGYSIRLYVSGDDPWVDEVYDRAWFDDVLATVQLPSQP